MLGLVYRFPLWGRSQISGRQCQGPIRRPNPRVFLFLRSLPNRVSRTRLSPFTFNDKKPRAKSHKHKDKEFTDRHVSILASATVLHTYL